MFLSLCSSINYYCDNQPITQFIFTSNKQNRQAIIKNIRLQTTTNE